MANISGIPSKFPGISLAHLNVALEVYWKDEEAMKAITHSTYVMMLILASLVTVFGQSQPDSTQEEAVVVSTNLVTVNVIVTDNTGRYVKRPQVRSVFNL